MFFSKGIFTTYSLSDPKIVEVLRNAVEYARENVRPSDALRAILTSDGENTHTILTQSLAPGTSLEDIHTIINIYNPARIEPNRAPRRLSDFSPEMQTILGQFETELQENGERQSETPLLLLTLCVLTSLEAEDRENLTILRTAHCIALLRERIYGAQPVLPLFTPSGHLTTTSFTKNGWKSMQTAVTYASCSAHTLLMPEHCFLSLLEEKESAIQRLVRSQIPPGATSENLAQSIKESLRASTSKYGDDAIPLTLTREHMHEETLALLEAAQKVVREWQHETIDTIHLLYGFLETVSPRLITFFQTLSIPVDLPKMRRHLPYHIQERRTALWDESPFRLPTDLLPSEDLTYLAQTQGLPVVIPVGENGQIKRDNAQYPREEILQILRRRENNHVLITGEAGIGKTSLINDLAKRAANGEIPFLQQRRFIWVDCRDLSPVESKKKLTQLLATVSGHKNLLICLDGLGSFFSTEMKQENMLLLRRALRGQQLQFIGIVSDREFEELLSTEREFLEFFTRVRVVEPGEDAMLEILKLASTTFEQDYHVQIDERVIERVLMLSTNYILSERHPAKSIKILHQACELADYERTVLGKPRVDVRIEDVIHVVAQITGLPKETLTGVTKKANYEQDLAEFVMGQDEAVKTVAMELRRIKAGWTDSSKPASVLLFAGLTGVGKTELAKALAQFYSSSKRLQTYTMANFTEPHSVSGIIGVPPGYVGYDQGGRMVNDLNADPYGVFLLDEAEKAHPEVWKPFLNLFDEAWIVDTRGTKAYADKAIFILTSNAGSEMITQMWLAGERDVNKIAERVKSVLTKVRHERSDQPVFSPEFIARIRHIVIFRPLDLEAMEAICRKYLIKLQLDWKQKREKILIVPDILVKYIAEHSHRTNQRSGNKEGGRIVERLLSQLVGDSIQNEQMRDEEAYQMAETIELQCKLSLDSPDVYDDLPLIRVIFHNSSRSKQ